MDLHQEFLDSVQRIKANKSVEGIVVIDNRGDMKDTCIIETTFDNSTTVYYADMVKDLSSKSMNSIRNIDATNEIILLVSTSKKYQFILAPSK